MTLAFRLDCIPPRTNHQRKRIVKIGAFSRLADAPALVEAKATLDALLLPHQPREPIAGPVVLVVRFTWPWLGKHGKAIRAGGPIPHTSRPDLSNVIKTLEDRLVQLRFIEDDSYVVRLELAKWWGSHPGIDVRIEPCA